MAFHQNIRRFRKQQDITQAQMADRLHVSVSTYCRMERGEAALDAGLLPRLAEIFKVPIEQLFLEPGSSPANHHAPSQAEKELSRQSEMSEQERYSLERVIALQLETIALLKERIVELKQKLSGGGSRSK